MKISLDPKFLTTAFITFFILSVVIVLVNKFAGSTAASAAGTVIGGIALKLFDRLDYSPTIHFEVSTPLPQVYSAIIGIFILYGAVVFKDLSIFIFKIIYGEEYICTPVFLLSIVLDWGGFVLGGWLIGHIFPKHAMRFTAIAGFVLVVTLTVGGAAGEYTDKLKHVLNCLIEHGIIGVESINEKFVTVNFGAKVGVLLGGIARAYVAIVMARVASRKILNRMIDSA